MNITSILMVAVLIFALTQVTWFADKNQKGYVRDRKGRFAKFGQDVRTFMHIGDYRKKVGIRAFDN